jgi:CHASE3 domain sensor protein
MTPLTRVLTTESFLLRKSFLLVSAFVSFTVAVSVLYGWLINSGLLKSVFPSLTPVNPVTAICFVLLSLCFTCFAFYPTNHKVCRTAATFTSLILLIIAGSMLIHYIFDLPIRVDRLLFTEKLGINRMAPTTASCFFLISPALLAYTYRRRTALVLRVLAIVTAFISLYALIGYAYGIQPVYGAAILNPMALQTAILFLLTSITLVVLTVDKFNVYISLSLLSTYFVAIIVFIFLSIMSFRSFTQNNADSSQFHVLYGRQYDVNGLRIALVDAETGQRGYLLTGSSDYLEPYNVSSRHVYSSLQKLQSFPQAILSHEEYAQLQYYTHDKMAELDKTVSGEKAGNSNAALAEVRTGRGKTDLDAIRAILASIDIRIKSNLNSELKQAKSHNQNSLLLLSASTAVILSLLLASLYLLQENLKRQFLLTKALKSKQYATIQKNESLESQLSNQVDELEKVKLSLENEVKNRTDDLNGELEKTQQQNSFMIDRELRMVELKAELADLQAKIKKVTSI